MNLKSKRKILCNLKEAPGVNCKEFPTKNDPHIYYFDIHARLFGHTRGVYDVC